MVRVKGFLVFAVGMILITLGLGMWRSPDINWPGFLNVWAITINEVSRFIRDPFAILGIVVLLVGIWIAMKGLRRLVRGEK